MTFPECVIISFVINDIPALVGPEKERTFVFIYIPGLFLQFLELQSSFFRRPVGDMCSPSPQLGPLTSPHRQLGYCFHIHSRFVP